MCTHAQVREHAEWHAAQVRSESARQAVIDAAREWKAAHQWNVSYRRADDKINRMNAADFWLKRAVRALKEIEDAAG